ncbi:hypothetical protein GNI_185890 [Gregarina niphandrodes]|uniref:Uncharacterized protein n=1 Tax=Gregarina niphandrodes TaxID=110365 RepID=A0A023AWP4_GRENI|nr:hypothetical protein GNI_185890 [Gregarina niphandrodes]EZG43134.1 hypothetical protein GNI_185890 [Gregarina niphandrodes]|eukprot:XP_011133608.1 hypothetical protein GNI_185890 [Gregarina niphandrodes]
MSATRKGPRGKSLRTDDASSDSYVPISLREFICKAWTEVGYRGGVMFWKTHLGEDNSDTGVMAARCDGSSADIPDSNRATATTPAAAPAATSSPMATPAPVLAILE